MSRITKIAPSPSRTISASASTPVFTRRIPKSQGAGGHCYFYLRQTKAGYVLPVSVCLFVYPLNNSTNYECILRKFFGGVGRGPLNSHRLDLRNRLDFCGDPDHDSDPGIFRSTPPLSRPNKAGLISPYVRTFVRQYTKSFSNSNEIWCVGRGR